MKGEFNDDLLSQSKSKEILQTIKKATTEKYFNSRDILEIKAAGFNVIEGLLDTFVEPVLKYRKLGFNGVNQHSQDLLILMGINKNQKKPGSSYEAILKVTDYISGMTDDYALFLYRKILGISI